jgi:hypothetical protein
MISRRVGEIVARLDDPSVPVRSAAQALGALAPILKLLYQWNQEPSLAEMKRPTGAINLELIATPPEELARMHREKLARENGSFATEHNDKGDGTLSAQRKQPPVARDDQLPPKKEAPTSPAKQPVSPIWEATLQRAEKAAPEQEAPIQGNLSVGPGPLSPEERRKQELEKLARLRAEWRGRPFSSSI